MISKRVYLYKPIELIRRICCFIAYDRFRDSSIIPIVHVASMGDIIIIVILILLNGLFSMTEMALVSARKSKLTAMARGGSARAKMALKLVENPDGFLSTIQIGITLIGILTGLFSGASFSRQFGDVLVGLGMPAAVSYKFAQILIVAVVTYLSIVIGELIPKRFGLAMPDKIAVALAPAMRLLSIVAMPCVWLLTKSTELVVKASGLKDASSKVTEDEIKSLIQEGADAGEVKEVEQDIMERALVLGDQTVKRIMTNRADLVTLNCDMTAERIRSIVLDNIHRAYPFYCENNKDVKGILLLPDILRALDRGNPDLSKELKAPTYFPESMSAYDALDVLRNEEVPCGLVCDEFGELQGILTLRDVLEGLIGMISHPVDKPKIAWLDESEKTLVVDGNYKWYDFLVYIDCDSLYAPAPYSTIAGWFLNTQRRIPDEGDVAEWHGMKFKVLDMDGARIDKFLVTLCPDIDGI